jgi:hypothetical protein
LRAGWSAEQVQTTQTLDGIVEQNCASLFTGVGFFLCVFTHKKTHGGVHSGAQSPE